MLTGKKLGEAIQQAIEKKAISKATLAREFQIKPPSISDWLKRGTIGKDKLPHLWAYFSDVVGPEHWGLEYFPALSPPGEEIKTFLRHQKNLQNSVLISEEKNGLLVELINLAHDIDDHGITELIGAARLLTKTRPRIKAKPPLSA